MPEETPHRTRRSSWLRPSGPLADTARLALGCRNSAETGESRSNA